MHAHDSTTTSVRRHPIAAKHKTAQIARQCEHDILLTGPVSAIGNIRFLCVVDYTETQTPWRQRVSKPFTMRIVLTN